jgi:hypothetical protein
VSRVWRVRAALLFLVGELIVHQGRYAVAPPELVREFAPAHRYLWWAIPVAGALLFLAIGHWCARLRRRPERDPMPRLPGVRAMGAAVAVALLAAFGLQECAESLIFRGHLPAAGELAGMNGWVTLPLAAAMGGVIALLLKGAVRVLRWAQARSAPAARSRGRRGHLAPPAVHLVPSSSVLARWLAGRAPPARA